MREGDREIAHVEQRRVGLHEKVFRGSKASRTASPMKISSDSMSGDHEEAGEAEPRRLEIGLALQQQFAERGRARRQAEAEEVERGQRLIEELTMNGRKVSVATIAFGSTCLTMILALERPSARAALHIFEVARAQEFGAHDVRPG